MPSHTPQQPRMSPPPILRFIHAAIILGVFQIATSSAHDEFAAVTDQNLQGKTQTAKGIVYLDSNKNQKRDENETGLEGVRVSNGKDIVKTNANGEYQLEIDDDQIVFVIKPSGYQTVISEDQLPKFYYIHKPAGSPPSHFPGVAPTGPLPDSIDFPLYKNDEPEVFRAIMFGDPQPRNNQEVDYIAHDIIAQIIRENAHEASFGVSLGDIAFDNLDTMEPLNRSIALIGIPWYNVIGNHDLNYESKDDEYSDETFERIYGPNYYSFDYGKVHFMVLDDVRWFREGEGENERGRYVGGLGETQMEFIRNDLAMIPADQMIVLMMHIPLVQVEDRQELYRLIEQRPFALSFSAHTHYQRHVFIGEEDGWHGTKKHHHVINVTACGSWWRGAPDENGIPHATMSDGGPNGYSIVTFDGSNYEIEFRAARRTADHQMNIYTKNEVASGQTGETEVVVNVFAGSEKSKTEMRIGDEGEWTEMERVDAIDPFFADLRKGEEELSAKLPAVEKGHNLPWIPLPGPSETNHLWKGKLSEGMGVGVHTIQIRTTDMFGNTMRDQRSIRVIKP